MSLEVQNIQSDYLSTSIQDSIISIKFQGDFFKALTDLSQIEMITHLLNRIADDSNLKVLIIHPFFDNAGVEEYLRFFGECRWRHIDAMHRFYNVLDQLIVGFIEIDKLVIQTCQGETLSIFMNVGLACDYRIVADDTVYHHAFPRRGMLPKGGGPFFLSRMLGRGKALELLLLKRSITADEALSHGIVDRVVPREDLSRKALEIAGLFSENPRQTLMGVKRLVNFGSRDLQDYLAFESRQIARIIRCNQISSL
jgi:2-(1,2-epoxy-1,2-dihydrophenyl)acetyl-CoA isomerase